MRIVILAIVLVLALSAGAFFAYAASCTVKMNCSPTVEITCTGNKKCSYSPGNWIKCDGITTECVSSGDGIPGGADDDSEPTPAAP